jgi:hypothetical protein
MASKNEHVELEMKIVNCRRNEVTKKRIAALIAELEQKLREIDRIERVFNPDRNEHHWGKRKLARDR